MNAERNRAFQPDVSGNGLESRELLSTVFPHHQNLIPPPARVMGDPPGAISPFNPNHNTVNPANPRGAILFGAMAPRGAAAVAAPGSVDPGHVSFFNPNHNTVNPANPRAAITFHF